MSAERGERDGGGRVDFLSVECACSEVEKSERGDAGGGGGGLAARGGVGTGGFTPA